MRTVEQIQKQFVGDKQTWDQRDLQRLIDDRIEERHDLEYKGPSTVSHNNKTEITKAVSAMANAAGGVVIFGISEPHEKGKSKHLPERIDPVSRSKYPREWLSQIIGQIQPAIENYHLHSIPIEGSSEDVVYVVVVPQSATAHQATDLRYYQREGDRSVPMQDYQIRDVMNRLVHPRITMVFEILEELNVVRTTSADAPAYYFSPVVINESARLAEYFTCFVWIPSPLQPDIERAVVVSRQAPDGTKAHQFSFSNLVREPIDASGSRFLSHYEPLLPSTRRRLPPIRLAVPVRTLNVAAMKFHWEAYADNAPALSGVQASCQIHEMVRHRNPRR